MPLWVNVCKIQHWQSTSYSFLDEVEAWSWAAMVAALDEESMAFVVTDEGRSRGLEGPVRLIFGRRLGAARDGEGCLP